MIFVSLSDIVYIVCCQLTIGITFSNIVLASVYNIISKIYRLEILDIIIFFPIKIFWLTEFKNLKHEICNTIFRHSNINSLSLWTDTIYLHMTQKSFVNIS